jgi:hypothetical protein
MSTRLTVTLPDGTTATRRTDRPSLYAIVSGPRDADAVAAEFIRQAESHSILADRLQQQLADGQLVRRRRSGVGPISSDPDASWTGGHSYHNFEIRLQGAEYVEWHCDSEGQGQIYVGGVGSIGDVASWIRETYVPGTIAMHRATAAKLREAAASAEADKGYTVQRWTSRLDLAQKALARFDHLRQRGHSLEILPVD